MFYNTIATTVPENIPNLNHAISICYNLILKSKTREKSGKCFQQKRRQVSECQNFDITELSNFHTDSACEKANGGECWGVSAGDWRLL